MRRAPVGWTVVTVLMLLAALSLPAAAAPNRR